MTKIPSRFRSWIARVWKLRNQSPAELRSFTSGDKQAEGPNWSNAAAEELVQFWDGFNKPGVHPDDAPFVSSADFATQLYPVPWAGALLTARTFFLFLNPGLSERDVEYEASRPDFVETLRENLRGTGPYFYLLDRYATHPGHAWARQTFGPDVGERHSARFCVLQLVPYHSYKGNIAARLATRLPSSLMIQRFVRDSLIPRARRGEIGLVVARSARLWGVSADDEAESLIVYQGWECRRGLQTPNSRGGQLLRQRL